MYHALNEIRLVIAIDFGLAITAARPEYVDRRGSFHLGSPATPALVAIVPTSKKNKNRARLHPRDVYFGAGRDTPLGNVT